MIAVGEAVVDDENHGEIVIHAVVDDFLLALGDAGADEDGALCRLFEAARLLAGQEGAVAAVADYGQQPPREEGSVAVAVAGDDAVGEQQSALNGREDLAGGLMGATFTQQVLAQGSRSEGGADGAALCRQPVAVAVAEQSVARVFLDVLALGSQLGRVHRHHVAEAGGEEGLAAGGAV